MALFGGLLLATGCAQQRMSATKAPELRDIHERLSYVIRKHGFRHSLRSERQVDVDVDSIFVSLPLDALKTRDFGLDKMLADVAGVCASPDFMDISIVIDLGSRDEADIRYLRDRLEQAGLVNRQNVRIVASRDGYNDITVTTIHHRITVR